MSLPTLKFIAKTITSTALNVTSQILDKGAELADETKDYLNTNDTSKREERKEKRTSIFGFDKNKS